MLAFQISSVVIVFLLFMVHLAVVKLEALSIYWVQIMYCWITNLVNPLNNFIDLSEELKDWSKKEKPLHT